MSFSGLLTVPVTLHLQGAQTGVDEHNNPVRSTETDVETMGFIGQQNSSESDPERTQQEGFRLFLEATAPIDGWDAVTAFGLRYEIVGPPWHVVRGINGSIHHIEADIRRAG